MALKIPKPYPRRSEPGVREEPMKVLCLGLSRTGTMSLYVALGELGLKSYHMMEASLDRANDSIRMWHDAIEAKYYNRGRKLSGKADFEKMLWNYQAVTDIPCILFVDELLAAYPEAKVIITSRDVDGWIKSVENSFYEILSWKCWTFLEPLDREYLCLYLPILRASLDIWTGLKGNWKDRSQLPKGFDAHYKHLRAVLKAQNREVLEFDPQKRKHGYKELCQFLDIKEVPEQNYPHVNEGNFAAKLHDSMVRARLSYTVRNILKWVAPVAIAYVALVYLGNVRS